MEQRSVLVQEALKYFGRGLLGILGLNLPKTKKKHDILGHINRIFKLSAGF